MNLPHDWSIEGKFDPKAPMGGSGGYFPAGIGWYRRTFTAPAAWKGKRVGVEFEGVYMNATVYVNGHNLGLHPYGYTTFMHDLTPHLNFGGPNVLAVRVDQSQHRTRAGTPARGSTATCGSRHRTGARGAMGRVHHDPRGERGSGQGLRSRPD